MKPEELDERKAIARALLSAGSASPSRPTSATLALGLGISDGPRRDAQGLTLGLDFPSGLRPRPMLPSPRPAADAPLPTADVVVVTWTVDEVDALSDVLTPGIGRKRWLRYTRGYEALLPQIRPGAPARAARRLASYCLSEIAGRRVLCVKSELHLNQDGVTTPPYSSRLASLPVKALFEQIIEETGARLVITTGTAGAVYAEHELGDVVVTRAAKFRLQGEFRDAPWNGTSYRSPWTVPTTHFAHATALMQQHQAQLIEPEFLPPTVNYSPLTAPRPVRRAACDIKLDGVAFPAFHPMLTTDFFEFGTSTNHLEVQGCAVEMGDAVLGLVAAERAAAGRPVPDWLVVRNCSDPQINGALRDHPASQNLQAMWAVYYYRGFGYWTSVNGALACWAVIAGL